MKYSYRNLTSRIVRFLSAALFVICSMNLMAQTPTTPTINGNVFGGGRMADVANSTQPVSATIDIYASTISGGVFGGNDITGQVASGSALTDASAKITIYDKCTDPTNVGEVYGGGNGYYNYVVDGDSIAVWLRDEDGNNVGTQPVAKLAKKPGENPSYVPVLGNTSVVVGENGGNDNVKFDQVFGGAKNAVVDGTASVTIESGVVRQAFAGNNYGGSVESSSLVVNNTKNPAGAYDWTKAGDEWGVGEVYGCGNKVDVANAHVTINGGHVGKAFAGGNSATATTTAVITINAPAATEADMTNKAYAVNELFGGNNLADMNIVSQIDLQRGAIGTVYGGGNKGDMKGYKGLVYNVEGYATPTVLSPMASLGFDVNNYPDIVSTMVNINAPSTGLRINTVYGGCKAANVDYSAYVHVNNVDAIGTLYGGCDIAGGVGAATGITPTSDIQFYFDDDTPSTGVIPAAMGFYPASGSASVRITGGTITGNVFGGGNGEYDYAVNGDVTEVGGSTVITNTDLGSPWVNSYNLAIQGGSVGGTIYGGGNMASVGRDNGDGTYTVTSSYLFLGKTQDVTGDARNMDYSNNTVFAGGRMADVFGPVDVLVKDNMKVGTLYAGNDISGSVRGAGRGTFTDTYSDYFSTALFNYQDPAGASMFNSYSNANLKNANIQVYVRTEPQSEVGTLFGGGNGDYGSINASGVYTSGDHVGLHNPVQNSTWLDIAGKVTTSYGGGNAANVGTSNTYVWNGAQITTAFGGGNSATITESCNITVNGNEALTSAQMTDDATTEANAKALLAGTPSVMTLFGGNNVADMYIVPRINLLSGSVNTVYGGGNQGDMKGYEPATADLSEYIHEDAFNAFNTYLSSHGVTGLTITPEKFLFFFSTALVVNATEKVADHHTGLVVGTIYGGCKAANVDYSSYVRIQKSDYVGDVYGGCDIAGMVGRLGNGNTTTKDLQMLTYKPGDPAAGPDGVVRTTIPTGFPIINTASYVRLISSKVFGTIYGGGNGAYDYSSSAGVLKAYPIGATKNDANLLAQVNTSKATYPSVCATGVSVEGGHLLKDLYGGGNKATVGSASKHGPSYILMGKTALGNTEYSGNPQIDGRVFAGGRMADVYGSMDVIVNNDMIINELYAGNDISGKIVGADRAQSVLGSAFPAGWGTALKGDHNAFDGTLLTSNNANVYVRVCEGTQIGTIYGGGNGDYTYEVDGLIVTAKDAHDNVLGIFSSNEPDDDDKINEVKPFQSEAWLDIAGNVTTAIYGGGNAAGVNRSHVNVMGDAHVGTASELAAIYGGCKSANVTYNTTVKLDKKDEHTPTIEGNVFGGCDISGNVGIIPTHTDHSKDLDVNAVRGNATLLNSKEFAHVIINDATITGRVFGGGNGLESARGVSYGTVAAPTGDAPNETYAYNSGDNSGKSLPVCQNSWVEILGGTIGTTAGSGTHTVFGGGQGAGTKVLHNVDLEVGMGTADVTINGICYGGSYAGFVNSDCDDHTRSVLTDKVTLNGDVYGGSYGNYVRGKIELNLLSPTITGNIFGGNNNAAQPECEASILADIDNCDAKIFGGGNEADFYGTTRITFTQGKVGYIFGGGNNAHVYGNTIVEVLGGEVCNDVFGGGQNGGVYPYKSAGSPYGYTDGSFGGNTTVIIRSDCLKMNAGNTDFDKNADGVILPNRGTTPYYTSDNDASTVAKGLYELAPSTYPGGVTNSVKVTGNVYGGSWGLDPAKAVDAKVVKDTKVYIQGNIEIGGNVYGGGNAGVVEGNTDVKIGECN